MNAGTDPKGQNKQTSPEKVFKYFLVIFLIAILLVGRILWPFLSILVLSFVLTAIFFPVFDFFSRKTTPVVGSVITCSIIFLVIFVPLVFLIGTLSREAYGLYLAGSEAVLGQDLKVALQNSRIMERLQAVLVNYGIKLTPQHINEALSQVGSSVGLFLYERISTAASNVLKFVVHFALMLLVIFFLLIDGKKLISFLVKLSPLPDEQDKKLMEKFHAMASVVLVVNGISGVIQGVLGGAVFAIFRLGSPLLWGFVMAILAFFPIVGIALVFVPASFYLFLKGRIGAGLFCLMFYLILSIGMEYLVKPKLVGGKVQMHTLLVFLAILGGLEVFGILGIIYGPLVITAFLTLTDIYRSSYEPNVKKI
jgi:predicted PurR-regulated permease PerM